MPEVKQIEKPKASPAIQANSQAECQQDAPIVSAIADSPYKPSPTYKSGNDQKQREPCWKIMCEFIFKICELAAFIAIIFTFLEMRKTRILDERAWVTPFDITTVTNNIQSNPSFFFKLLYKNTGKTPALNVNTWIAQSGSLDDIPTNHEGDPKSPNTGMLLVPDGIGHSTTTFHPLSESEVQAIKRGNGFYIWGITYYDDIFGKHHWTQFCFFPFLDGTGFGTPPIHNACDDADNNK